MSELSEYEKKRLDNIRQNQQVLRSLHIPVLPQVRERQEYQKVRSGIAQKRERQASEPTRRSSRIIEKQTGVPAKMEKIVHDEIPKKRAPRPPRITSQVPFAPQIGATDDFVNCFKKLSSGYVQKMDIDAGDIAARYHMKNEHCILKLARDRIYSMAIHPSADKIIASAGTKEGELAFWDATDALNEYGEEWKPKYYLFAPHNGSISNLKYLPSDDCKLMTTSYDGSCLTMDLKSGTFSPWFQMEDGNQVVTGFDISNDGRLAYHSDTRGFLRVQDLISGKTEHQLQLHEAKIGGVSVSCDQRTLATCSNDRSIALWDIRKLRHKLCDFHYKNAVTAVNFHPTISDCFVSTCYDDHIRIHYNISNVHEVPHNNQTGRWVTLFKAIFDPKSSGPDSSIICIGNMSERGVDMYDLQGIHLGCATSEWLTAQPAVSAVHPIHNIMVSGNASGKVAVWSGDSS